MMSYREFMAATASMSSNPFISNNTLGDVSTERTVSAPSAPIFSSFSTPDQRLPVRAADKAGTESAAVEKVLSIVKSAAPDTTTDKEMATTKRKMFQVANLPTENTGGKADSDGKPSKNIVLGDG